MPVGKDVKNTTRSALSAEKKADRKAKLDRMVLKRTVSKAMKDNDKTMAANDKAMAAGKKPQPLKELPYAD